MSRWEEILREHLATSPHASSQDGWKYKQKLVETFPLRSFWASFPDTIKVYINGQRTLISLNELLSVETLDVIMPADRFTLSRTAARAAESTGIRRDPPAVPNGSTALVENDLRMLSDQHRAAIFEGRSVRSIKWSSEGDLILRWVRGENHRILSSALMGGSLMLTKVPDPSVIGFEAHKTSGSVFGQGLLNEGYPFVQWLVRVRNCCEQNLHDATEEQFQRLVRLLERPVLQQGFETPKLSKYLDAWRELPGLPSELYPPVTELTRDMFTLQRIKSPGR